MSTFAISESETFAAPIVPTIEDIKDNLQNPQNWLYLIPTIGAVVIGILFAPNFALGLVTGGAIWFTATIATVTLASFGLFKIENETSEYAKALLKFPLLGTLIAPIGEELVFRGGIQSLLARAIVWLSPAATAAFLGTGLSVAVTVAIVATSVIFGLAHLFNNHANSHIQAIITGIGGIALGVLAAQFGLGASIAAHLTINTLMITLAKIVYKESETPISSERSRPFITI